MSRFRKVRGHVRPIKNSRYNINKYIDEELAIYDMMLMNNMALDEGQEQTCKTIARELERIKWITVKDYIYEYEDLEMLWHLRTTNKHKPKRPTIESKMQSVTFCLSSSQYLEGILIKFKRNPNVFYPIQTVINSPFVFFDDDEVVGLRNDLQVTTIQNLIHKYFPTSFNPKTYNLKIDLNQTERYDKFTSLISEIKRNVNLGNVFVNIRRATKLVEWIDWRDTDDIEMLGKFMRMKPSTHKLLELSSPRRFVTFDVNDFNENKTTIFEKIAGKEFKAFTKDMKKSMNISKTNGKLLTDKSFKDANIAFPPINELQRDGIAFMKTLYDKSISGLILADGMGMGKTYQTISTVGFALQKDRNLKILVICPLIVVGNWQKEIKQFLPEHSKNFTVINFDKMKYINPKDYDILLIDEAQNLHNRNGKMFKKLSNWRMKFKIIMTGTPVENSFEDYVALVELIYPEFGRVIRFSLQGGFKNTANITPILNLTKGIFLKRDLDSRTLPVKLIATDEMIDPSEIEIKLMNNLKTLFRAERKRTENETTFYNDAIVALMRSMQIISSFDDIPDEIKRGVNIPPNAITNKMKKTLEIVKHHKSNKEKIIIFCRFKSTIKRLHSLIPKSVVLDGSTKGDVRTKIVKDFQETDDHDVIIISLKAGNAGITLTRATVEIIFDQWWNPSTIGQALARAYRLGQKKDVTAYLLYTRDTIDEVIKEVQEQKTQLTNSVNNHSKNELDNDSMDNSILKATSSFLLGDDD